MKYPLGSKRFFEAQTANVPGVEIESIARVCPGHIHISLVSNADTEAALESLRRQYLDACTREEIIGTQVTVSIKKRRPGHL